MNFISKVSLSRFIIVLAIVVSISSKAFCQDTVKIMSWNLLNYTTSETDRNPYYRTVIGSVSPDIFVCQEIANGAASVDSFYKNVIQIILPQHVKGTFIDGYDSDNALFYNPAIFTFVSNTPIRTALRDINEFKLIKTSTGDTLRIYSVHLKASSGGANDTARGKEADSLRKVTNVLVNGSNFLVCGDFNFYSSSELAYQKLMIDNVNDDGNFIDPITMPYPVLWNNSANKVYHTQSPRVRSFGGGSTGGMDDRFDLMMFSNGIVQSGGMYYVPNSFVAYGNDGNHYNDSINKQPNTAVTPDIADGIHYASDHLPIYAKFTFPGSVSAPVAQPTSLQFSNVTTNEITGSFTAAVPAVAGYLVVRKAGSAPAATPVNGTAYSVGASLNDGVVIANTSATTFTDSGLTPGVVYYYKIFSRNGTGTSSLYLTSAPLSGSQATVNGTPVVTVTGSLSGFGVSTSGSATAAQSVTVSGQYLTGAISITPPLDFEVSLSSSTGFVAAPSALTINHSGGVVAATSIYVRFRPLAATGSRQDTIRFTATGASGFGLMVSGFAQSTEPTVQPSVTVSAEDAGSISLSFPGGNGSKRLVLVRQTSPIAFVPQDTIAVTGADSNFTNAAIQNDGSKVVYNGSGQSVTVTGLSALTTYYCAVYEYNTGSNNAINYFTTNPGNGTYQTAAIYRWVGGSSSFATAANWVPARSAASVQDILKFNAGDSVRITGVTAQQVGQMIVSNNSRVILMASAACTLGVAGKAGTDLIVNSGSSLYLRGNAAITITLAAGATGQVSGRISVDSAAHKILSSDASGLVFSSGSSFIQGPGASGNPFGTTFANSVLFGMGSEYIFWNGANPFGMTAPGAVAIFQPGSWFRFGRAGANPAFSGRTYANIELNIPEHSTSHTGSLGLTVDTLRILRGSLAFTLTGGITIKNALIVESGGTFIYDPASAATLQFTGTTQAVISGGGTIRLDTLVKVKLNNPQGLRLLRNLAINDELELASGSLDIGNYIFTFEAKGKHLTSFSSANMITMGDSGQVRKAFTGIGSFLFPIGSNGNYSPSVITLNSASGFSSGYIGVGVKSAKHPDNLASAHYLNRYWTVTSNGITNPNVTAQFTYPAAEVSGIEQTLYGGARLGSSWQLLDSVSSNQHQFTAASQTQLGSYTAADPDYVGRAALLQIKAAVQGYYDTTSGQMRYPEVMKAFAANTTAPYQVVDSALALVKPESLTTVFPFKNLSNGNYLFKLTSRNALAVWLTVPVTLNKGSLSVVDITQDSSSVLGMQMSKKGTVWCLYSGDLNQDGIIDFSDIRLMDNYLNENAAGYSTADVNGNGTVDYEDLLLIDANALNFLRAIGP